MNVKGKELKFIRYGGLSPVKQRGYKTTDQSFHSPPSRRGFYAFVWPYIEPFLLSGGTSSIGGIDGKNNRIEYLRDDDGNKVPDHTEHGSKIFSVMTTEYKHAWKKHIEWCDKRDEMLNNGHSRLDVHESIGYDPINSYKGEKFVLGKWNRKARVFKVQKTDLIWHHLGENLKPFQELKTNGSWSQSTVQDYSEALHKEFHRMSSSNPYKCLGGTRQNFMRSNRPCAGYSIDHLEVFFERVK